MSIRNKNDIRVYSELPFQINLVGQHRDYIWPACKDNEPTMNFVDWSDIEYAHSRGNLFSSGLLVFDESEREEIYRELRIRDWQNKVWYEKDIVDAIENPTLEKMQRIIDIKDPLTFERIRGKVVNYTNLNKNISQKVVSIVNARYRELTTGVMNSKITIRPADVEPSVSVEEVADLKRQLAQMQKLMEQMAMNNANAQNESVEHQVEQPQSSTIKRSGRKATVKK